MAGAAGDDALAVLCANDKSCLFEAGNDGYAGGFGGDVVRDAAVWRGHEFVKNLVGSFDACVEFGFVRCVRVCANEGGKEEKGK